MTFLGDAAMDQNRFCHALLTVLAVCQLACSGGGGGGSDDGDSTGAPQAAPFSLLSTGLTSQPDSSGTAVTKLTIPPGTTSFQVITSAPGRILRVSKLQAPDGTVLFDGGTGVGVLDGPAAFANSPSVLGFPNTPRASIPAGTYTITHAVRANRATLANTTLSSVLALKKDAELTSGTLQVNLVYLGTLVHSQESRTAVRSAMETTKEILAKANLSLNVSEFEFTNVPDRVRTPEVGDPIFEQLGNALPSGVNVFFAVEVTGLGNREDYYGRAGSVSCALIPTPRSGIAIHMARAAGGDGEFDSDRDGRSSRTSEIQILGESIAHELGRCLGLADSVTFRGNNAASNDGLDTPKCFSLANCQLDRGAAENFMFPFVLDQRDEPGAESYPRTRVAAGQAAVMQLSPAVR